MARDTGTARGGWIFYDASCPLCGWIARHGGDLAARAGYAVAPLQTPWVIRLLELDGDEPLTEMKVLTPDGRLLGGPDAVLHLAGPLGRLPGLRWIVAPAYRWVSEHRHAADSA